MRIKRFSLIFLILLFILSNLNLRPHCRGEKVRIFNLGLIIHDLNPSEMQTLMDWIKQFDPFNKWNFIIWTPYNNLLNKTFVDFLKQRGLLIGADGYLQCNTIQERKIQIDNMVNAFENAGISLKGLFMFQPDTWTLNYVYEHYGFDFYVGYCFDQFLIDYMTMRGGWQLPYYHSPEHCLKPSKNSSGLVVFPHVIWDWIGSFTVAHALNTHILDVYLNSPLRGDKKACIEYCLALIEENLNLKPFGYASTMFEWELVKNYQDRINLVTEYYRQITSRYSTICQMYNETAKWFKSTFPKTPTYNFTFESPYNHKKIEWYYDLNSRIARVDGYVRSYVNFYSQKDIFLSSHKKINFSKPPSENNCIDNSLNFKIDDLGGGINRKPGRGDKFAYNGNLNDFPLIFASSIIINSTTTLPLISTLLKVLFNSSNKLNT